MALVKAVACLFLSVQNFMPAPFLDMIQVCWEKVGCWAYLPLGCQTFEAFANPLGDAEPCHSWVLSVHGAVGRKEALLQLGRHGF